MQFDILCHILYYTTVSNKVELVQLCISIFQDYLHNQNLGMEPLRYYRVYCRMEGMAVNNINTNIINDQDEPPPDYDSVVVADLEQLPNYSDIVKDSWYIDLHMLIIAYFKELSDWERRIL